MLSGRWRINITLIVWMSTEGEHSLPAMVAAAVKTVPGDYLLLSLLGLRTREGLSPFLTRSGEQRYSVTLASVKRAIVLPACAAKSTEL